MDRALLARFLTFTQGKIRKRVLFTIPFKYRLRCLSSQPIHLSLSSNAQAAAENSRQPKIFSLLFTMPVMKYLCRAPKGRLYPNTWYLSTYSFHKSLSDLFFINSNFIG